MFRTLRNLLLAFVTCMTFLRTTYTRSSYIQQLTTYKTVIESRRTTLYTTGTLNYSNALLLTDVVIVNNWFMSMWNMTKGTFFYFFSSTYHTLMHVQVDNLLTIVYVWFVSANRKPPDKEHHQDTNLMCTIIYCIEDLLYSTF